MTTAVNQGYAMARNPDLARAWNARLQARAPQSVAEYRATVNRLAARFPDAVKVQVH
jgi:hypothetical protein